jgi:hypothetical protein
MTKTTRNASIALIAATMLALTACAPSAPADIAKSEVDKIAESIRSFDGAAIGGMACDGADLSSGTYGALTPELAEENSIELPIEVTVGKTSKANDDQYYGRYAEEFGGDVYSAELSIPALASGADEAATPDVVVVVKDGSACIAAFGS